MKEKEKADPEVCMGVGVPNGFNGLKMSLGVMEGPARVEEEV